MVHFINKFTPYSTYIYFKQCMFYYREEKEKRDTRGGGDYKQMVKPTTHLTYIYIPLPSYHYNVMQVLLKQNN